VAKPVELNTYVRKLPWKEGVGSLVLFSLSAACGLPPLTSDDVHGSHGVSLAGQVRDAESYRQIPNAGIYDAQTEQLLATTDSSGHYFIPSLRHRSYQFVARADRFADNNFEVALQGTIQHQDVPLLRLPCDPRAGANGLIADCFEQEFCGMAGRCKWVYGAANLTVMLRSYCTAFLLDEFLYNAPPPDENRLGHGGVFRITGRDVRTTAQISLIDEGGYNQFVDAGVYLAREETLFKVRMMPTAADQRDGGTDCEVVDEGHYCAPGYHWTNPQGGCIEDPI
jgi:hypothetical protein